MSAVVVHYSGGVSSFLAAKRAVEKFGREDVTLLFCDTGEESEGLYRFLEQGVDFLGARFARLAYPGGMDALIDAHNAIPNTRMPFCTHELKRELGDAWVEANAPDCLHVFGIEYAEVDRGLNLKARRPNVWLPLWERPRYALKAQMIAEVEGLGLSVSDAYRDGADHDNCFQGDERFITDEGHRSFRETSGQSVRVLGRGGAWVNADIKAFGRQRLRRLVLSRHGEERSILVTAGHRWFRRKGREAREERLTSELRPGDMLSSNYGRLSYLVRPSAYGIAHGIVFGDGTRESGRRSPALVALFGDKATDLLQWFPLSPTRPFMREHIQVNDLPRAWKDVPPLSESKSYLYGWLAGYFATDGSVTSTVEIGSSRRQDLEFVREVCVVLGIGAGRVRTTERIGIDGDLSELHTVTLAASTLREDFFLRPKHLERFKSLGKAKRADWKVVRVEETDRFEEVFCAVVPDGHEFALEGNVQTGNCGSGCVKGGHRHWAWCHQHRPEVFWKWSAREDRVSARRGFPCTILRDRTGGRTRPLPLKEFALGLTDPWLWLALPEDEGTCGCYLSPSVPNEETLL